MTHDEIESIARVAAKTATMETLAALGIDATKPFDMQRDFAHLRWWREIAESVMKTAIITFVTVLATGIANRSPIETALGEESWHRQTIAVRGALLNDNKPDIELAQPA